MNDNTGGGCEEKTDANIPNDLDPKLKAIVSDKFTPKTKNGVPRKQKAMTSEQWKAVNDAFKVLHEKSCIFRVMIKDFTDKGLKIQMGYDEETSNAGTVMGKDHLIFGNKFFKNIDITTIVMSHEFFHIFQNNTNDPIYTFASGVNEGKMNQEFEAYFFTELIEYAHDVKATPNTSPMGGRSYMYNYKTSEDFQNWIESPTMNNNRTQYPTEIKQDSLQKYMERFKEKGLGILYPTHQIKSGQKLKGLEKLINLANSSNCTSKN